MTKITSPSTGIIGALTQAAKTRIVREKNLMDDIDELSQNVGLCVTKIALYEELSQEIIEIKAQQFSLADGRNEKSLNDMPPSALGDDKDIGAVLLTFGQVHTWSALHSKGLRDQANAKLSKFSRLRFSHRNGRKPYPNKDLVIRLYRTIERATGRPFSLKKSYAATYSEEVYGGAQIKTLMSALNLHLFISGSPKPNKLADLIRQDKKLQKREGFTPHL